VPAVRRDYSTVIPLVRHRFQPDHPDVTTTLARSRDVQLTIDARLQMAIAAILKRTLKSTDAGRGAVVVLDADSGEILASVSYPLPGSALELPAPADTPARDSMLDRARYGLYPPGSTFKMITAAAALRQDMSWRDREFVCQRLSTGRFGARVSGYGAIHDDERDKQAHGRLAMHDATVRSCNAYFAQLAAALGSDTLARTASLAGIELNSSQSPDRIRATLPHAGYGQGEVLASPLRMARVAAAIGSDGVIRETPIVQRDGAANAAIETPFVSPPAAKLLASYLRDAVTRGTGRLLRDHPGRIAGKTGTAELDEAASHAWFTGFAPYGPATRRVAFAVLLEHAGYGGGLAADVAGQVARVAGTLGLAK
jgi:peptidoglycan glycosyltransferase